MRDSQASAADPFAGRQIGRQIFRKERTMQLNAYVNFDGQCEAAFKFYEKCLVGKIVTMSRFGSTPAGAHMPADWSNKIMHAHLTVGEAVLYGADAPPEHYKRPVGFAVSIQAKQPVEADRIFHALAENGKVDMPIQETFWAARFGMLTDQFGIPWMVNCDKQAEETRASSQAAR
jgi:PhnB protein